jgi:hypothetical protein
MIRQESGYVAVILLSCELTGFEYPGPGTNPRVFRYTMYTILCTRAPDLCLASSALGIVGLARVAGGDQADH